jgi:competence protein ComEC
MRRIYFAILLIILALVALFFYIKIDRRSGRSFSVTFFNIGQGDAALIRFADNKKILIDCGPDKKILAKLGETLPFYDNAIDYLIVTHPDLDHYGGCLDVLNRYRVKNIITNGVRKKGDRYWEIWDEYSRSHSNIIEMTSPHALVIAGANLDFLSPGILKAAQNNKEGNNDSIVFKLTTADSSFLFTGDMETALETCLIARYCRISSAVGCPKLKATILKAGHHGSDSSTGRELLEAVQPEQTVISVGQNTFGHPSLRVLKRLERARTGILRTDERGDIIIR